MNIKYSIKENLTKKDIEDIEKYGDQHNYNENYDQLINRYCNRASLKEILYSLKPVPVFCEHSGHLSCNYVLSGTAITEPKKQNEISETNVVSCPETVFLVSPDPVESFKRALLEQVPHEVMNFVAYFYLKDISKWFFKKKLDPNFIYRFNDDFKARLDYYKYDKFSETNLKQLAIQVIEKLKKDIFGTDLQEYLDMPNAVCSVAYATGMEVYGNMKDRGFNIGGKNGKKSYRTIQNHLKDCVKSGKHGGKIPRKEIKCIRDQFINIVIGEAYDHFKQN